MTPPTSPKRGRALVAALLQAKRPAEAVEQFRAAVALEPHYAEGYHHLAAGLESIGDSTGAVAAYRDFLARAPRRSPRIASARRRLEALGAPAVRS